MDRIDLLRTFVRVVEAGSYTKAAATLEIPRSTVSTAVSALETRVGTRLLSRTTRKVSPTQDGLAFYERCVRLIDDFEETEGAFRRDGASPTGKLHVNMPGRIARLIVAPALPEFLDRHPGIDIQLGATDRAVDLVGENVDCALRVGPLRDSGLIARHVGWLQLINVASPVYLERFGAPLSPYALVDKHQTVCYASPTTGRPEAWEWVENGSVQSLPLSSRVTVNSAEAYIACCLAGLGLIQIPAYDVQEQLISGELVEVMPLHRASPMLVTLLYPHRRHLSHRLRLFADWLVALLGARIARLTR
jgi:LysR family transcriptional regulator for bpeEF and oprC